MLSSALAFNSLLPKDPRIEFWNAEASWPRDSKDHLFAARAIKELGRESLGAAWSDSSPATELNWELPESLSLHTPFADIQRALRLIETDIRSGMNNLLVPLLASARGPDASPFPTRQEWARAVTLAKVESTASWEEFRPFTIAASRLAEACASGRVKSAIRPMAGGEPIPKEWHFWNGEHLWFRFETCRIDEALPYSTTKAAQGQFWLFIERKSFGEYMQNRTKEILPAAGVDAEIKAQARKSRRPGRRPVHDWDKMTGVFAKMVHCGEVTSTVSTREIAQKLSIWASEEWSDLPDLGTIEDKVRLWRADLLSGE